MKNQLYHAAHSIYSLLFTPKIFFENKKPDDLKAALPYLLAGIVAGNIAMVVGNVAMAQGDIPPLSSFISLSMYYSFFHISLFSIEFIFIYIIAGLLGKIMPFVNILTTMMFVSFTSVIAAILSIIAFLFMISTPLDILFPFYFSIVVGPLFFIWKSCCAIIGLSIMQQMNRKVVTISVLLVFSFFYLSMLFINIFIIFFISSFS